MEETPQLLMPGGCDRRVKSGTHVQADQADQADHGKALEAGASA